MEHRIDRVVRHDAVEPAERSLVEQHRGRAEESRPRGARECAADGFLSKIGGLEQLPQELELLIATALF